MARPLKIRDQGMRGKKQGRVQELETITLEDLGEKTLIFFHIMCIVYIGI